MTNRISTYIKTLIPTVLLTGWALPAFSDGPEYENIVERIEAESNGNVVIEIDDELLDKIMTDPGVAVRKKESKDPNAQRNGFRIQVFSDGRNQSTLEARAKARGNAIVARFPKYRGQVYTYSIAPNWYT
ncbi:MAG: hypothetical protein K2H72_07135, partial [Muribaculaceae bacterium]|nr:hypothetical protein [Muribaculaceae bacterium]